MMKLLLVKLKVQAEMIVKESDDSADSDQEVRGIHFSDSEEERDLCDDGRFSSEENALGKKQVKKRNKADWGG